MWEIGSDTDQQKDPQSVRKEGLICGYIRRENATKYHEDHKVRIELAVL
jgi:hypothetical protein